MRRARQPAQSCRSRVASHPHRRPNSSDTARAGEAQRMIFPERWAGTAQSSQTTCTARFDTIQAIAGSFGDVGVETPREGAAGASFVTGNGPA